MKKVFFAFLILLLTCYYKDSFAQAESFLEGAMVTSIQPEGGYIWFATYGQGIYRYSVKDQKWFNFSTKNQNADSDFFYTIALNKDYLWAGSVEGLFIYDLKRNNWRKRKFAQGGELGNWIRSLCYDPDQDVLWIGRFKNLTRLDVKRNRYSDIDLTEKNDSKTNNFKTIHLDGDSLVWFGTESGVHIYNKSKAFDDKTAWRFINNKGKNFNGDGSAVSIPDILFEENNIWFATDEFITKDQPDFNIGGVYKFDRKLNWDRISTNNGIAGNGIYCLSRTGNKIWAGLYTFNIDDKTEYGRGIVFIDRYTEKVSSPEMNSLNLYSKKILSMYFDGNSMWLGTDNGLYKIKIDNPLAHLKSDNQKAVIKPGKTKKTEK